MLLLSLFPEQNLNFTVCSFADATSQQGCIVKVYYRPCDRPYIKWCSANGGRHSNVALLIHSFVLYPRGDSSVTRVFDWLAISDGSLFHVSTCAVFCWALLFKCCIALAHSIVVRQTHIFDEPGGLWYSCHQNACVGGRIQKKNSTHTKVGETKFGT